MKKLSILLVAGIAAFSTFNLSNVVYASATNSTDTPANNIEGNSIAADVPQVQDTMVLGKLYFVNLKEGEQPIMTALSLFGNRCGSESFNHKPYATKGIRSVFELDEWIEFHPKSNASAIKVMVFTHKADQSFYTKNSLNDKTPGYIQECDLNKDPEQEEADSWGSFYLHPEEVSPGYYDFVFICKNKVVATMLTHFFKQEEIYEKSDSELEELMKQSLN
ncbi:MAG: hypothetical protein IKR18_09055 [Bacteroidaceae bacterium]|nr:hypothetical protein [Bacteroidaceae bacterium]